MLPTINAEEKQVFTKFFYGRKQKKGFQVCPCTLKTFPVALKA
jgi:hypothetical protein